MWSRSCSVPALQGCEGLWSCDYGHAWYRVLPLTLPSISEHPNWFVFQIDSVENTISNLTVDAPMVMRSVKTRTAARMMIHRFREATELLAENVSRSVCFLFVCSIGWLVGWLVWLVGWLFSFVCFSRTDGWSRRRVFFVLFYSLCSKIHSRMGRVF